MEKEGLTFVWVSAEVINSNNENFDWINTYVDVPYSSGHFKSLKTEQKKAICQVCLLDKGIVVDYESLTIGDKPELDNKTQEEDSCSDKELNKLVSFVYDNFGRKDSIDVIDALDTIRQMDRNDVEYVRVICRNLCYPLYNNGQYREQADELLEKAYKICTLNKSIGSQKMNDDNSVDLGTISEYIDKIKTKFNVSFEFHFDEDVPEEFMSDNFVTNEEYNVS